LFCCAKEGEQIRTRVVMSAKQIVGFMVFVLLFEGKLRRSGVACVVFTSEIVTECPGKEIEKSRY
jgi:hypothetical protein